MDVQGIAGNNPARQQMIYDAHRKSVGVAYLLWFFLGSLGIHRFYLKQTGTAVVQLLLAVAGWLTIWIAIGLLPFGILGIWLLVDLFLIPGMAREHNLRLADHLTL